jgi:hypothetical protein
MKTFQNILKIFFGVIIATAILNTAVGQSIKTPMNQTVYTLYNGDTAPLIAEWEAAGANWISDHSSGAQRVGAATSNYNCHSWAWHVSDGGSSSNSWTIYLNTGRMMHIHPDHHIMMIIVNCFMEPLRIIQRA